uniref:alpha-L-rhamnosidase C-terminal domain-containing protein n=1 Tax=Mediterraneibacter glycyrrhizinilyticus TaxID=342942 RepID=UPI00241E72CA
MFRHAAGINTIDAVPGIRKITVAPILNWKLRKMDATYDSPAGTYRSSWELPDPKHVTVRVSVPFGCSADLTLPFAGEEVYKDAANPMNSDVENGICHLKPGEYAVTYELTESLKKIYSIDTPIRELQNNPETAEVLGKFVPANAIPNQYLGYPVREMSEKFGGRLPKESMEMLDAKLREL